METSKKVKALRIEINLSKSESGAIRKLICKVDESRKEAIERIITNEVIKAVRRNQELIPL